MLRRVILRMTRIFTKKKILQAQFICFGAESKSLKRSWLQVSSQIPPFPSLKTSQTRELPFPTLFCIPSLFLSIQILSLKCTVRFEERLLCITLNKFSKYQGKLLRKKMNYEAACIRNLGRATMCKHQEAIQVRCQSNVNKRNN